MSTDKRSASYSSNYYSNITNNNNYTYNNNNSGNNSNNNNNHHNNINTSNVRNRYNSGINPDYIDNRHSSSTDTMNYKNISRNNINSSGKSTSTSINTNATVKKGKHKKRRKNSKPQLILLIISLIMLAALYCIYYHQEHNNDSSNTSLSMSVDNVIEPTSVNPDYIKSAANEYPISNSDYSYPDSFHMDIPYISQYPQLPTGCEITSLTEVLHYLGFDIDKEELARNYLEMKDVATKGCFVEYFWGSPWKASGSGCFAPAIANAANAFFNANNSSHTAYIMSYQPPEMLYSQLAQGHPVIVWTSFDYSITEVKYNEVVLDDGTVFTWPRNEHCVALAGYDTDNRTVTLADPTYGIVTRDMEKFEDYYKRYYYQAVVIK